MKQEILKSFESLYLEKYDKKQNDNAYYYIYDMVEQAIHDGLTDDATNNVINTEGLHQWNTPLMGLMHDTRNDFDRIKQHLGILAKLFKEDKASMQHFVSLEYLKSGYKKIMDSLDEYYVKRKNENKPT